MGVFLFTLMTRQHENLNLMLTLRMQKLVKFDLMQVAFLIALLFQNL